MKTIRIADATLRMSPVSADNAPGDMGAMTFLVELSRTGETVTVGKYVASQPSGGASETGGEGKIA